jgi:hypothetical protein
MLLPCSPSAPRSLTQHQNPGTHRDAEGVVQPPTRREEPRPKKGGAEGTGPTRAASTSKISFPGRKMEIIDCYSPPLRCLGARGRRRRMGNRPCDDGLTFGGAGPARPADSLICLLRSRPSRTRRPRTRPSRTGAQGETISDKAAKDEPIADEALGARRRPRATQVLLVHEQHRRPPANQDPAPDKPHPLSPHPPLPPPPSLCPSLPPSLRPPSPPVPLPPRPPPAPYSPPVPTQSGAQGTTRRQGCGRPPEVRSASHKVRSGPSPDLAPAS